MNARALIVDDEDDIREVAQVSMELSGTWHTMAAKCGPGSGGKSRRTTSPT